jgi:hypothetical protein
MDIREFLNRAQDIGFVASGLRNVALKSWYSVAPGEFAQNYRSVRDFTMASNSRLRALHDGVSAVVSNGIAGDIVECGTARGGSAALLGLAMRARDANRRLWIFDTFEGLPEPSANDPDEEIARRYIGTCKGSIEDVTALLDRLDLLSRATLVKGLFQDTLHSAAVERVALLHLDGDWYDSVMVCLQVLYDKVSPGGIVQIDDYGYWQGAKKAVADFFEQRGQPVPPLRHIDYAGRQFTKPLSAN